MRLSDLLNTPLIASESKDPIGHVSDVAIRPGQSALEYVLINLSTAGGFDPVAFSADLLHVGSDKLECVYTQDQINNHRQREAAKSNLPVNIEGLPPLVVGPFGDAIAPAVMGAVVNDAFVQRPKPEPPGGDYRWFTGLQGSPAFDATGELGVFHDVEFDPDSKALRFIVIDRQTDVARVHFEDLRNIPDNETHIVLSRSSDPSLPV